MLILAGSSHPDFTRSIEDWLCQAGKNDVKLSRFANGELSLDINVSVRNQEVFIVQTATADTVNDAMMELMIMVHACKISSAKRVVAVLPYFPYAKQRSEIDIPTKGPRRRSVSQERKVENSSSTDGISYNPWPVQTNTLISNLLSISGVDHFITMDLHDPQFQGFFDAPLENLPSLPLMAKCIKRNIPGWTEAVIVSPDAGGAKRVAQLAEALDLNFALVHQDRRSSDAEILIGNVTNKLAILVDDLADTCDTLINAAEILHNQGATSIFAIITHGIFSGNAAANLEASRIDRIYVSNTIPQSKTLSSSTKIHLFDVSCMFSEAIRRIHNGESVSYLFQPTAFQ